MHDHGEILELAAAAIDFDLEPSERVRLSAALETCPLCRRQAAAMRATATILRRPSDIGTPSHVRDVVLGAALRGDRRAVKSWSLLVATLSLLAVLGGAALIAGGQQLAILPSPASPSIPLVSSPSVVATAAETPTPESVPTPSVAVTPTPVLPSPEPARPLQEGEVAAMVTDGRLVIRTKPSTEPDSAIFKTKIYPGQRVLVLEGPVEASGYPWFRVRLGDVEGWAAGAGVDGEPWLAPVSNGVIAFVRTDPDAGPAIYTVTPDETAGEALMLADPRIADYAELVWSPDGTRLAFVGTLAESSNGSTEIFVVDADGTNLNQLTENDVNDTRPQWSPDGTRIAVERGVALAGSDGVLVASAILVMDADGSGIRILGEGSNHVWSPDGQQVAMTVADGGASRVWVQSADGRDRRAVADISVASAAPAWSPDGRFLVVSSSGLSLIELSTGSVTSLTAEPGSDGSWSIGGAIAFSTTRSASPAIFVVNPDGSGLARVSEEFARNLVPTWSPDGRLLLLGGEVLGSPAVIVDPTRRDVMRLGEDVAEMRSPAWQPRLP